MADTAESMNELDTLIQQAEIQQKQMEMELQFQKNMALFKRFAPVIHEQYFDYTPTELHLGYNDHGYIDLINSKTGKNVYDIDPNKFCQQQVEAYQLRPTKYKIGFNAPPERYFFQLPLLSKIINHTRDMVKQEKVSLKNPIGVMLINGCGLGYHISEIINSTDIYTLIIFDPHKDSFYASLHTIDWEPIIMHCYRPGRLLKLFIGSENDKAITSMRMMTNKIGLHNITNTFTYSHLTSDKTTEFFNALKKQFHLTLTGTGFLEDEQISIAHTISNLNSGIPVFNGNTSKQILPPAIIVGNGPSLDGLLIRLKEVKDDVVIFSCGTTTGTLYREGIIPDFHIEMERIDGTSRRIENGTDADFRDKITLLALNTVHPKTMALFNHKAMSAKVNDPGDFIINQELNKPIPALNLSNPTCTNTGLSYALAMGFEEIHLFGVDLGMIDEEKHHASGSQYYDKKNKPLYASAEKVVNIRSKGNFSDEIKTTATLDTSRANMELSINNYPNAIVSNPNNGAYIKGTTPTKISDLKISLGKKDKNCVSIIMNECFTKPPKTKKMDSFYVKSKYLKPALNHKKNLYLPKKIDNTTELQHTLDNIHLSIFDLQEKNPTCYWLLTGSIQNFFTLIMRACLACDNKEDLNKTYNFCRGVYHEFLSLAFDLLKNKTLMKHDLNRDFSELEFTNLDEAQ